MLLIMGTVAVTAIGIAIVVGVVLFLLILLKLSFRGLPVESGVSAGPPNAERSHDRK